MTPYIPKLHAPYTLGPRLSLYRHPLSSQPHIHKAKEGSKCKVYVQKKKSILCFRTKEAAFLSSEYPCRHTSPSRWLAAAVLVDLYRVDGPIRIRERARVLRDIGFARIGKFRACSIVLPNIGRARPAATEGGVEDDVVLLEELIDSAAAACEVRRGRAPGRRIGSGRGREDVGWDGGAREVVDGDVGRGPLDGVDAAACSVERRAEACWVGEGCRAAGGGCWIARIAVIGAERGDIGRDCVLEGAARRGMQRRLILRVGVHALESVNLTVRRPARVRGSRPKGRPGTTSLGHVAYICNEETMGICFVRLDTNGWAAGRDGVQSSRVDAEEDSAVFEAGEGCAVSGGHADVFDRSLSWVGGVEEIEVFEEVIGLEVIHYAVCRMCDTRACNKQAE